MRQRARLAAAAAAAILSRGSRRCTRNLHTNSSCGQAFRSLNGWRRKQRRSPAEAKRSRRWMEDWRDLEAVALRDGYTSLLQEFSQGMGAQENAQAQSEPQKARVKRVIGMDKDLPPRVLVEFSEATSITELSANDVNKFFRLSKEDEALFFCQGLPKSYLKEFHISCTNALLIRKQFLKLVDHLTKLAENKGTIQEVGDDVTEREELALIEPLTYISLNQRKKLARERRLLQNADLGSKKQIVLDGLLGSGKSVLLAMLVHWARSKGWLVCYVPSGRSWTHDGLYYKNEASGLWDTPVQAVSMLEDLMKSHNDLLDVIPCRVFDPVPLGEGPGIGRLSGVQEAPIREGATLTHLVQFGIDTPHAAVGVAVRLRKELSLVEEVPVLIAVDEFNSWFTFSGFHESYNEFGRRQIHARELAMVHAFRDMTYGPFMLGAFSHSTNVGKLPKQLPSIPYEAKVFVSRFDFYEASVMLKYYLRKWAPKAKFGKRARRALYMLTNGNATELRDMAFLSAGGMIENLPDPVAASG
ncbi:hypothetical protein GOP47_0015253 [Adiantum capillus-veneris]|uniref:Small ribosomal subunit protein mS29 n=1 Tax=Adiantum capillus-veneris TaxID=13818 RepID=A0A9D4UK29_ADICA|nr:hypothetical protein GOP47_0015253 [Adiantum capillus-veneris]